MQIKLQRNCLVTDNRIVFKKKNKKSICKNRHTTINSEGDLKWKKKKSIDLVFSFSLRLINARKLFVWVCERIYWWWGSGWWWRGLQEGSMKVESLKMLTGCIKTMYVFSPISHPPPPPHAVAPLISMRKGGAYELRPHRKRNQTFLNAERLARKLA